MEWQITMQRYVDIQTDSGFKAVFGEERNREVLIDLLNAFLPAERHVRDIEYSSTELPGFTLSNKSVRLDLRCTGDDGRQFIVEVQCYRQSNLFSRCVLYAVSLTCSAGAFFMLRKSMRQVAEEATCRSTIYLRYFSFAFSVAMPESLTEMTPKRTDALSGSSPSGKKTTGMCPMKLFLYLRGVEPIPQEP